MLCLSTISAATEPKPLAIANASFEEPLNSNFQIAGWVRSSSGGELAAIAQDMSPNVNRAKDGSQWLRLDSGGSIGQRLGRIDELISEVDQADRLLIGLALSSMQFDGDLNEVRLSIELHASPTNETWEDGNLVSSKQIVDLTNDERGDLNSYIDGYAVLNLDIERVRADRFQHLWLVFRNSSDAEGKRAALLIDLVQANIASKPVSNEMPNIVIVFQDDMGYGDASVMNRDSKIKTPHIDRLANQGIRFTDAHTAATICGPSRIGLLTGTMPSKLGVRGNFVPGGNDRFGPPTIPAGTPTIATMCRDKGYDTAVVGKWGIPSDWDSRRKEGVTEKISSENASDVIDFKKPIVSAEAFGFNYRYIFDESRPFLKGETEAFEENPQPFGWHENGFADRDVLTHTQDKLHEYYLRSITDRAVRYIQTKAGLRSKSEADFRVGQAASPFYLHYLTHAPHLPIVPARQFHGMSQAGLYGDFVIDLDYSLGRLMQALEESGIAQNTLVIFSADNGPEHFAYERARKEKHFSMGPLRGVKRDLYEGGHRVPLVVSWPATIKPGSVSTALVNLSDWYATIAAIIHHQPDDTSGLDSMNILPILRGEAKEVRGLMLQDSCVNGIARAIRVGPWKYIDQDSGELNRKREPEWFRELRNVQDVPGNELFNLTSDVAESQNQIVNESNRAREMKALFDKLWPDKARSTPPFARQIDSDGDGYSDFFEEILMP